MQLPLLAHKADATVRLEGRPELTGQRTKRCRLSTFWLLGRFGVGEYALIYRAGLSNETRPFKLGLWDKSYSFGQWTLQI